MSFSEFIKELAFVLLLFAVAYALTNAYFSFTQAQRLTLVYGAKALFGILTIVMLLAFHAHFSLTKYDHSALAYYAKKKMHSRVAVMSFGMVLLASAFILEFAIYSKALGPEPYASFTNIMEALSLMCFGYSYYRMARH